MPFLSLITSLLLVFSARAEVLPAIFYQDEKIQEAYCEETDHQTQDHWLGLISEKIQELSQDKSPVARNALVTLSYLELFKLPARDPGASFMGYVYANASHHLGRLVRYSQWPKDHPLRVRDQELIRGETLKLIVRGANRELSRRLMFHSFNLYKTLAPSLASAHLCGSEYALKVFRDPHLERAFSATTLQDFIGPFVSFEQSYLQRTMYSELLIALPARSGVLDDMRWISFNGEEQITFKEWCRLSGCDETSFDLESRINFDIYSITNELILTGNSLPLMQERVRNTSLEEIALYFLQ